MCVHVKHGGDTHTHTNTRPQSRKGVRQADEVTSEAINSQHKATHDTGQKPHDGGCTQEHTQTTGGCTQEQTQTTGGGQSHFGEADTLTHTSTH